jgi:hypothetical protein
MTNRSTARHARLLATLALATAVALAIGAGPASAAPVFPQVPFAPISATAPTAADEGEWEETEEEWEWEESEEEAEGEEGTWEEEGEGSGEPRPEQPPAACQLYRASARVVASDRNDSVRLVVHYSSSKASPVTVEYWLKGSRGALQMKPLRRHMSKHGSLHGSERVAPGEMDRVRAARVFIVDVEMPGTPSYCERYCTRRLTSREHHGARTIWSEPPLGTQPPN